MVEFVGSKQVPAYLAYCLVYLLFTICPRLAYCA